MRLRLCRTNGHGFSKDKFTFFSCLSASITAAHCRRPRKLQAVLPHFFRSYEKRCQKSTRRVCAPSRLPWGWGTICTFFACTKKVPKKYTEGLRALPAPGDAVKLRLRFASQVLRRYWKFRSFIRRKKARFSLLLSDCGLIHQCFLGIFLFLLYGDGFAVFN